MDAQRSLPARNALDHGVPFKRREDRHDGEHCLMEKETGQAFST